MFFSFIHTADIHLGRTFGDLSSVSFDEHTINLYKKAVNQVLDNIINFAITKNVDFILFAGDTFDSDEHDLESKLALKAALKKAEESGIKVFLIAGNHDPISSYNKNTFNYDENSNIKIVGLNTPIYSDLPIYNKENQKFGIIHALSFQTDSLKENPINYFSKINQDEQNLFHIALLHCDLDGDKNSPYAPCSKNDLTGLNYNYWALGHIHKPEYKASNIQYAGTVQSRNSKETGAHGIRYVEVENNNIINNTFIPLDIIRYENIEIDISQCIDETHAFNEIENTIIGKLNSENNNCLLYLIKLNITGFIKYRDNLNDDFLHALSDRIREISSGKIYISQYTNSTKQIIDAEIMQNDEGIVGELYKTTSNLKNISDSFDDVTYELNNIISKCNFSEEEFKVIKESIINSSKEEILILCSSLFADNGKEED